ncbi:class I SAM-dependent methyltransferase [Saccharomonospora azurea]|uniref:Methylase involved in ubiquinone/menaquinone biosynthesis n=1 Tax=Saccharomonospora azurea NA-128 TaxID=882081 RepID=H8GAW9_9PSEU|nr:class I SAM-dependent methyltransferase [Saccharomonospora azurea]EHK81688.1 type 11 methyltransferase [Saccharomonospora azurea SZMC 14600]EHY88655.1 methylase involved in ubiquinone/menaquinone biosynthesis [Saccharomonospora azurea NA-128]
MSTFEALVAEGEAVPTEGWDFSWFDGRATEQRPSWGYARLLAERMSKAEAALDIQTGGGEVLASIPVAPPALAATESWPPNLVRARRNLAPFDAQVVEVSDSDDLPFPSGHFDLVVSRHPVRTRWDEIHRVLRPDGTYLSQAVGAGSVRELTDFLMGPQPVHPSRSPIVAVADAESAGLDVVDLRQEALRMEFHDIAAVVHFLRKVIWIVPGFTVDAYRDRLAELHDFMQRHGPFVAYSHRFLIEARKKA